MQISQAPQLRVMHDAVLKVSRALVRDFGEIEQLLATEGNSKQFAQKARDKCLNELVTLLSEVKADCNVYSSIDQAREEKETNQYWVLNPLDGLANFAHALEEWCISIALCKNEEQIAGLVYFPIRKDCFYAVKGEGAWMEIAQGMRPIILRLRAKDSHFSSDIILAMEGNINIPELQFATRRFGTMQLALLNLCAGRVDAVYGFIDKDRIPATLLICKEANLAIESMPIIGAMALVCSEGIESDLHKLFS